MKLRIKFIISAAIISILFSAMMLFGRIIGAKKALFERTQDRTESRLDFFSDIAGEYLEKKEIPQLVKVLNRVELFKQIAYCRVVDTRGQVIFKRVEPGIKLDEIKIDHDISKATDGIYDVSTDIVRNSVRLGTIEMGTSIAGINEAVETMLWQGLVVCLVFVIFITAVTWLLTIRLSRELDSLFLLAEHIKDEVLPSIKIGALGMDIGKIAGTLIDLHRRLKEEEIKRKEAEGKKADFFAMTVHDLKQPVTSLKAAMDMLVPEEERKALSPVQIKSLGTIAELSLGRLTSMMTDVLNTARLSDSDYVIEKDRIQLSEFMKECAAINSISVKAAGKKWALSMPDDIKNCWIFGESDLIKRVIGNLVLNAIAYTPDGGMIKLGARLRDGAKLGIYVSDEGEGIAENFREEIFKKYKGMGKDIKNLGLDKMNEPAPTSKL